MITLFFVGMVIFAVGFMAGFGFAAWVVGGEMSRGWKRDEPLPFSGGSYPDEEEEVVGGVWDRYLDGDR